MTINQLFKNKPPLILINELIKGYGLENINDFKTFSKRDIKLLNIVKHIYDLSAKFDDYYLPCKKKIYFNQLNVKKSITILRQCLKLYNYRLISKEKYIKSEKIIIYRISPIGNVLKDSKDTNSCVIFFD